MLNAAEAEKFDVFVTADQNLTYRQNLKGRAIAVLVLTANRRSVLEAQRHKLTEAVDGVRPGDHIVVRFEQPPKRKRHVGGLAE